MTDNLVNILDANEEVIKTYKPAKARFYFASVLATTGIFLFLMIPIIIMFITDESPIESNGLMLIPLLFGVYIIVLLIVLFITKIHYNKRLYAYTNKRVIVQSGFIGIDFKALDHKMIGATEVRVDFIDKIFGNKTGTIKFGSQASQLSQQGTSMYVFSAIEDPYNEYREIKKYIDSVKE